MCYPKPETLSMLFVVWISSRYVSLCGRWVWFALLWRWLEVESIRVYMWTLEALMLASFVGFSGLNLQCSYIGDCRLSLAKCGCILYLKEVDVLTWVCFPIARCSKLVTKQALSRCQMEGAFLQQIQVELLKWQGVAHSAHCNKVLLNGCKIELCCCIIQSVDNIVTLWQMWLHWKFVPSLLQLHRTWYSFASLKLLALDADRRQDLEGSYYYYLHLRIWADMVKSVLSRDRFSSKSLGSFMLSSLSDQDFHSQSQGNFKLVTETAIDLCVVFWVCEKSNHVHLAQL